MAWMDDRDLINGRHRHQNHHQRKRHQEEDLIAGRKRRRYSTPPLSPDTMSSRREPRAIGPPPPPPLVHPRDHELRGLFFGHKCPPDIFNRLEARLGQLKQQVQYEKDAKEELERRVAESKVTKNEKLRRTIEERTQQLRDSNKGNQRVKEEARIAADQYHQELDENVKQIKAVRLARAEDTQLIKELKKKNYELEEWGQLQDGLLKFNTKATKERNEQVDRLTNQVAALQKCSDQKDVVISSLNDLFMQLEGATGEQALGIQLEAQAQRTLGLVQGLQSDVSARNAEIQGLQASLTERGTTIEGLRASLAERDAAIKEQSDKQEEQVINMAEMEKAVQAANKRAEEATAVAEEQQKLIEKMLSGS